MGVLVTSKKRKRRQFTSQYKAEVVELVRASGKSVGEISRELDLTETAVRRWVQQAERTEPASSPSTDDELKSELRAARKRIRELEMEREILKKAAAFFAKENS